MSNLKHQIKRFRVRSVQIKRNSSVWRSRRISKLKNCRIWSISLIWR